MVTRLLHRFEKVGSLRIGVVLVLVVLLGGIALFQKTRISTTLRPGDTVEVTFARDYQLRSYVTKVKVAGVPVGIVTDVEYETDGSAVATLKVDKGVVDKLRSTPSAAIRPNTLLGGNYYVELVPGGDPGGSVETIPPSRTSVPVELDRVLEVLKPEVRVSMQRTIDRFGRTLDKRGQRAVGDLTSTAPGTLRPATGVLRGLQGRHPERDLESLVRGLEDTARALTSHPDHLRRSLDALATTSSVLDDVSPEIARTIESLPPTLRTTRTGLAALGRTLDLVREVSADSRPVAKELSAALERVGPALTELRPVVRDLRPALHDLRPVIENLVPIAHDGTQVLEDLNGPVIDRVRGPVVDVVNSSWHGTGDYANGGNDTVLYKELGDLFAGMNLSAAMTDRNGAAISFQPGFGIGSISGTPLSFERLLMRLAYPEGSP